MEEDGAAQEVSSRVDHKFFPMFPRASQRFQVNQRCKAHLKVLFIITITIIQYNYIIQLYFLNFYILSFKKRPRFGSDNGYYQ